MKILWDQKLEAKLSALGTSSSKETFQTLAYWIAFNRKRLAQFVPVLKSYIQPTIVLSVIDEVLLLADQYKDRLEEFRIALGEQVLLAAPSLASQIPAEYLSGWDDANVFSNPLIMSQLKKKAKAESAVEASPPPQKSAVPAQETPASKDDTTAPHPAVTPVASTAASTGDSLKKGSTPKKDSPKESSTPKKEADYDFEKHGIPEAPVPPTAFQEPCRQIATLQIARDLRSDSAIQLSSALSAMPEDVRAACAKAASNPNETVALEASTARDFSLRVSSSLLGTDMEEQLQNVQLYRNIVDSQRQAREALIRLLVQSRCKLGAAEAAAAFTRAERAKDELVQRKQILMDAMELEGLDVAVDDSGKDEEQGKEDLPPLSWYHAGEEEPPAKRLKL